MTSPDEEILLEWMMNHPSEDVQTLFGGASASAVSAPAASGNNGAEDQPLPIFFTFSETGGHGLNFDASGKISSVSGQAKKLGIKEGDKVVEVAGVKVNGRSVASMLNAMPRPSTVKVDRYIRTGTAQSAVGRYKKNKKEKMADAAAPFPPRSQVIAQPSKEVPKERESLARDQVDANETGAADESGMTTKEKIARRLAERKMKLAKEKADARARRLAKKQEVAAVPETGRGWAATEEQQAAIEQADAEASEEQQAAEQHANEKAAKAKARAARRAKREVKAKTKAVAIAKADQTAPDQTAPDQIETDQAARAVPSPAPTDVESELARTESEQAVTQE
jgi:hypothetical protein